MAATVPCLVLVSEGQWPHRRFTRFNSSSRREWCGDYGSCFSLPQPRHAIIGFFFYFQIATDQYKRTHTRKVSLRRIGQPQPCQKRVHRRSTPEKLGQHGQLITTPPTLEDPRPKPTPRLPAARVLREIMLEHVGGEDISTSGVDQPQGSNNGEGLRTCKEKEK